MWGMCVCVCVHNFNDLQTKPAAFLARKLTVDTQRQAEWGKYNAKEDIAASYEWERTSSLFPAFWGGTSERNGKNCSNMQLRWPKDIQRQRHWLRQWQRQCRRMGKNMQVKNKLSLSGWRPWRSVLHIMRIPAPSFFTLLVTCCRTLYICMCIFVHWYVCRWIWGTKKNLWFFAQLVGSWLWVIIGKRHRHSVLFLNYMPLVSVFCYPALQLPRPLMWTPGQLSKHVPCNKLPGWAKTNAKKHVAIARDTVIHLLPLSKAKANTIGTNTLNHRWEKTVLGGLVGV